MSDILKTSSARFKAVLLKRRGVALGLRGEAGIGKSYLAGVLLQNVPCQTISLHATDAWIRIAQRLPKAKKVPIWAERTLERVRHNESVATQQLLDAIAALLATLAPVVIYVEDLHEATTEQLEFWKSLAQTVTRMKGVGILTSSRNELPELFEKFRLEPLTKEQSDSLLGNEVAAPLPKESLEFIYSKAAGNPLYTLEYFRLLSRQGAIWNDGKHWHWRKPEKDPIPVTVEALIELLLEGVSQNPKLETALQAKALLPLDTDDTLWAKVAELSIKDLDAAKLEFRQKGVFNDDTFAHPLYREVSLKNLSKAKRQQLAQRALEVLQDEPVKAARFIDDSSLENEKALELLKKAVQQARENKDEASVGRLLAKAVRYAIGEEKGLLALEAARALEIVDVPIALTLVEEATQHLSEPTEALYLYTRLLAGQGEDEKVQQVIEQLPRTKREGSAWIAHYSWLLYMLGKDDERIAFWESHPEAHETCDVKTAYHIAWAYIHVGKMSLASELIERIAKTTLLTQADQCDLFEAKATLCFYSGDYLKAEAYFSESLILGQSNSVTPATANVLRNRSVSRMQQGRFLESLPDLEQALKIYSETGRSLYYAETLTMKSYVLVELGEYEQTETVLLEALDIFRRVEPQPKLVDILVCLCGLYLEWGIQSRHYLALKYAKEAEQISQHFSIVNRLQAAHARSRTETALDHPQLGLQYANQALELATRLDILEVIVNSHHARGLALLALGQTKDAREAFTLACQLAEEHGLALEANKYGLELDRLNNDIESARKRVQWLEECGLMNGVNIAKRYFPALSEVQETIEPFTATILRLDVLGKMRISRDGKIETIRGRKRQEFLALLLNAGLSGRTEVSRLELLDTLYPNEDELKALQSLKTLIHMLRSSFGEQFILTTSTGYGLGAVQSDAEVFLKTGDTTLWRGPYLEGIENNDQDTVQESLYLALFEKAKTLLETNLKEVTRVAKFLLLADPYNADYLILALQALRQNDNYRTLGRVYEEAKSYFAELGEPLPEQWTTFLASNN